MRKHYNHPQNTAYNSFEVNHLFYGEIIAVSSSSKRINNVVFFITISFAYWYIRYNCYAYTTTMHGTVIKMSIIFRMRSYKEWIETWRRKCHKKHHNFIQFICVVLVVFSRTLAMILYPRVITSNVLPLTIW